MFVKGKPESIPERQSNKNGFIFIYNTSII